MSLATQMGGFNQQAWDEEKARRAEEEKAKGLGDPEAFGNQRGYDERRAISMDLTDKFMDKTDPRSGYEGQTQGALNMMHQNAMGQGPGQDLARAMAQQQAERGNAQQMGMANSARGAQGALAARSAAQGMAGIGTGAAQAATQGGLQAQMASQQQYGGMLSGLRGQDLNSQIQAQGLRQSGALGAQKLGMSNAQLQQQAMIERERQKTQRYGIDNAADSGGGGLSLGGIGGAIVGGLTTMTPQGAAAGYKAGDSLF